MPRVTDPTIRVTDAGWKRGAQSGAVTPARLHWPPREPGKGSPQRPAYKGPTSPSDRRVCVCATVLPFYSGAPRCLGWFWGPAPHFAPLCSHQQSRPMVSAHSVAVQARCQLCPPGGESTSGLKRQRGLGRHLLWRGEIRPRMKGSPGRLHAAEWLWPTDELGGNVWSNCTCRKSVLHAQWPAFCSGCPFGEESLSGALAERVWQPGAAAKRADLEGLGAISK